MNHAIITGPTGAIGIALIEELAQHDYMVTAVCHMGSKRIADIPTEKYPEKINIVECNLDELDMLPEVIDQLGEKNVAKIGDLPEAQSAQTAHSGHTTFYHLAWSGTTGAARNDAGLQQQNVEYALKAVEAAHKLGCTRFIGAGSQAEYGLNPEHRKLNADTPTDPFTEYGKAKLEAGIRTRELCERLGMDHTWVRILSVYGPYDGMQSMVMSTIDKLLHNISPQLTRGQQQWDYLYSKDAARALRLLGECEYLDEEKSKETSMTENMQSESDPSHTYCLGSGRTQSLMEYAMTIGEVVHRALIADDDGNCAACGASLGGFVNIEFGAIPYSENQIMYLCADISDLTRNTGFVPEYSFTEGIKETVEYCRKYNIRN